MQHRLHPGIGAVLQAVLQGVACASDGALHDAVRHAIGECQVSPIDEGEDCDAESDALDDARMSEREEKLVHGSGGADAVGDADDKR